MADFRSHDALVTFFGSSEMKYAQAVSSSAIKSIIEVYTGALYGFVFIIHYCAAEFELGVGCTRKHQHNRK